MTDDILRWALTIIAAVISGLSGIVVMGARAKFAELDARLTEIERRAISDAEERGKHTAILSAIQADITEIKYRLNK